MSSADIGTAAIEEGADIVELKTIPAESSDSIYQWTRLTVRIEGVESGFPDRTVVECWTLVFEGKFLRDGPDFVDCPPTPAP
ncbi:MAG: hypothetical protein ABMA25_06510 [Ilumatobacteraceae bacterium]